MFDRCKPNWNNNVGSFVDSAGLFSVHYWFVMFVDAYFLGENRSLPAGSYKPPDATWGLAPLLTVQ